MGKKKVVIKIGSSNLVSNGEVNQEKISKLADLIKEYKEKEIDFIIVSSGAVAVGRERLNLDNSILSIGQKQALSAIGQPILMKKYQIEFNKRDLIASQILLTSEDLYNRKRYINSKETMWELLKYGVTPIVNENDTVSTEEIKIGDNDTLSALVASSIEANLLIILSDIDGLYDKNPKKNPDAKLIPVVKEITKEIIENSGGAGSKFGTGGMLTKIEAAKICMKFGIEMAIINGNEIENIKKILDNEKIGTRFLAEKNSLIRRKMWIAYGLKTQGKIYIDNGAEKALGNGKSLLVSGIFKVDGKFSKKEMVSIYNSNNEELARGLVNYSSNELENIKGSNSEEIKNILGYIEQIEGIHRDKLVMLK